jgi:maltose-binding protein MalE
LPHFEAENPDIKVELDTYPFRQLFETIEVRMKAQDANLDMISVDVPLVASYSLRGYLAPLDDYFTADDIKKTWLAESGKAGTYNGHFMAAPQNTSANSFRMRGSRPQRASGRIRRSISSRSVRSQRRIAGLGSRSWTQPRS